MAFAYKKLTEAVHLDVTGTDAVTLVANPSGKTTYIRCIILHNVNTTTETVTLYIVADSAGSEGEDSDTTNRFYKEDILAGSTRIIEFPIPGIVLTDQNDTLQGACTTHEKVLAWVYGGEE
jgi:hypothetical protein